MSLTINKILVTLHLKTFWARLRYAFRFKEMLKWDYEICNNCGVDYRLAINVIDETWIAINGKDEGCLCMNCFLKIAQKKNITISLDDFERIWIFNPDGEYLDLKDGKENNE